MKNIIPFSLFEMSKVSVNDMKKYIVDFVKFFREKFEEDAIRMFNIDKYYYANRSPIYLTISLIHAETGEVYGELKKIDDFYSDEYSIIDTEITVNYHVNYDWHLEHTFIFKFINNELEIICTYEFRDKYYQTISSQYKEKVGTNYIRNKEKFYKVVMNLITSTYVNNLKNHNL
jgi:hypothetical protein